MHRHGLNSNGDVDRYLLISLLDIGHANGVLETWANDTRSYLTNLCDHGDRVVVLLRKMGLRRVGSP